MANGCALSTGYLPQGGLPRNSVDRITDRPDMTIAVDRGRKASIPPPPPPKKKKTNNNYVIASTFVKYHNFSKLIRKISPTHILFEKCILSHCKFLFLICPDAKDFSIRH